MKRTDPILARFVPFVCLAVLASVTFVAPLAEAQDADASARARALFTQGVQLTADGQFAEAEARFREALTFRDAPAIRYNLASILLQRGAFPEARALADSVLADTTSPDEIRRLATTLAAQIDTQAGYLLVRVRGRADVAVDGWALADPSAEVPLSPGTHTATATRDGETAAEVDVTIATGAHETIELDAIEAPIVVEIPAAALEPRADDGDVTGQWWFWTGIGATVVGAAVVIAVIAVTSAGTEPAYQGNFEPGVLRF